VGCRYVPVDVLAMGELCPCRQEVLPGQAARSLVRREIRTGSERTGGLPGSRMGESDDSRGPSSTLHW
jgi:hypothetical protein